MRNTTESGGDGGSGLPLPSSVILAQQRQDCPFCQDFGHVSLSVPLSFLDGHGGQPGAVHLPYPVGQGHEEELLSPERLQIV